MPDAVLTVKTNDREQLSPSLFPGAGKELLTDEMNDLISHRPHWIIRSGNVFLFLIVAGLLLASWFISYPDMVKAPLKIVAANAPKLLRSKTEGKLVKLLAANGQEVQQGMPLAYLESTANHDEVLRLKKWLQETEGQIAKDSFEVLLGNQRYVFASLGELQPAYQEFQNVCSQTQAILQNGYYLKKKAALLKDLGYLNAQDAVINKQKSIAENDYNLQQVEYNMKEKLAKEKVIAPLEFNQDKSKLLAKEQSLQQASTQLINNASAMHNKRKELLELEKSMADQKQFFLSALFNLKSKTQEWVQLYVVIAPETGKLDHVSFLQDNQWLTAGQELFYIVPAQQNHFGEMLASQNGIGKLKEGQKVLIRVAGYPYTEFGTLKGNIEFISTTPYKDSGFLVKVKLPDGLRTNYNKTLQFRNSLTAQAEVITDDRRLIERLLGKVTEFIKR